MKEDILKEINSELEKTSPSQDGTTKEEIEGMVQKQNTWMERQQEFERERQEFEKKKEEN